MTKMDYKFDITKTITLVVSIAAFSVIVYFLVKSFKQKCPEGTVFDSKVNKCRQDCDAGLTYYSEVDACLPCKPDQDYIDGLCYDRCDPNLEIRCGTKCYFKDQYTCIDNEPCTLAKSCPTGCCGENQYCLEGKCQDCDPDKICGPTCCTTKGQSCWGGRCCDADKQGYDITGKNAQCCDSTVCGPDKICCDATSGELCSPDGKCVIGCPNVSKPSLYQCDGKDPPPFTGTPTVCNEKDVCAYNCSTKEYKCVADPCQWASQPIRNPAPLLSNDGETFYQYKKKAVAQCIDNDGNAWIKAGGAKFKESSVSVTGINSPQCTEDDCIKKIIATDVNIIGYDFNKDNVGVQDGLCTGKIDCGKALLSNQDDVNAICSDISATTTRCCVNGEGGYTGQVCPVGKICKGNRCIEPEKYIFTSVPDPGGKGYVPACAIAPEGYPGTTYKTYDDCIVANPTCPPRTSACVADETCLCCGVWTSPDGKCNTIALNPANPTGTPDAPKRKGTEPPAYDSIADLLNPPGVNCGGPGSIPRDNYFLLYIPDGLAVNIVREKGDIYVSKLKEKVPSKTSITFSVWSICHNFAPLDATSHVEVDITDPYNTENVYKYTIGFDTKQIYVDQTGSPGDYVYVTNTDPGAGNFYGSSAFNVVNCAAAIGNPGTSGHPGYVFLSIPISNSALKLPRGSSRKLLSASSRGCGLTTAIIIIVIIIVALILLSIYVHAKR